MLLWLENNAVAVILEVSACYTVWNLTITFEVDNKTLIIISLNQSNVT